jgi:hypothetical protein
VIRTSRRIAASVHWQSQLLLYAVATKPTTQMACVAVSLYTVDLRAGPLAGWIYVAVFTLFTVGGMRYLRRPAYQAWLATVLLADQPRTQELASRVQEYFAAAAGGKATGPLLVIISRCEHDPSCTGALCNGARIMLPRRWLPVTTVVAGERLADSPRLRFVIAHEAGHRWPVFPVMSVPLYMGFGAWSAMYCYYTRYGLSGLFTCVAVMHVAAHCSRWLEEIRCDRRGARCTSIREARETLAASRAIARAEHRRRPWGVKVIYAVEYLLAPVHPPFTVRLAAVPGRRRVTASG